MRGQYKFYHWSIKVYTGLSLVNFIVWCYFLVPFYAVSEINIDSFLNLHYASCLFSSIATLQGNCVRRPFAFFLNLYDVRPHMKIFTTTASKSMGIVFLTKCVFVNFWFLAKFFFTNYQSKPLQFCKFFFIFGTIER